MGSGTAVVVVVLAETPRVPIIDASVVVNALLLAALEAFAAAAAAAAFPAFVAAAPTGSSGAL